MKRNFRVARRALRTLQDKGFSLPGSLLLHLPAAGCLRAYRVAARYLNARFGFRIVNTRRLQCFLHTTAAAPGTHFFVIFVPGTLQFLLPCLSLIPDSVHISVIANGARPWEMRILKERFPRLGYCTLVTLPFSSLGHGDALTLLLKTNTSCFGVIDHDFYVFDPRVFDDVHPGPGCILTAIFGDVGNSGLTYPLTYFLFFDTTLMQALMQRYGVDARIYRQAPERLGNLLKSIGLADGAYLKTHHNFFDSLTLLYALAAAEGAGFRFLQDVTSESVAHVGSTSSGTPRTKPLLETYIQLRFLELVNNNELSRRYRGRFGRLDLSSDVRARIPLTPENFAKLAAIDAIVERLQTASPQRH